MFFDSLFIDSLPAAHEILAHVPGYMILKLLEPVPDNRDHVGHELVSHERIFIEQVEQRRFVYPDDSTPFRNAIGGEAHFVGREVSGWGQGQGRHTYAVGLCGWGDGRGFSVAVPRGMPGRWEEKMESPMGGG